MFHKNRVHLFPVFCVLACILSLTLLSACNQGKQKPAPPPSPVTYTTVETSRIADKSNFVATLISRKSVTMQPRQMGQIRDIFVTAGDYVKKGQLIMVIDPEQQEALVASTYAGAQSQKAGVAQASETLKTLQEQREGYEAALQFAQSQYDRYAALYAQHAASQQEYEQYANALKQAQANLEANRTQIGAQRSAISVIQKQYDRAMADNRQAKAQLGFYNIRAPFDGIIGDIPVKEGNYVQPLTQLFSLTDSRALEVNISVPSERRGELKTGMPVEILAADGSVAATTSIFFIAPNSDPLSQTVLVKAKLPNFKGRLGADELVDARIIWRYYTGMRIPTQAVTHMGGRDFVYVLDKAKAEPAAEKGEGEKAPSNKPKVKPGQYIARQQPIMVGPIDGLTYILKSGLEPGDRLITTGIQKLSDGVPVNPTQEQKMASAKQ